MQQEEYNHYQKIQKRAITIVRMLNQTLGTAEIGKIWLISVYVRLDFLQLATGYEPSANVRPGGCKVQTIVFSGYTTER